MPRTMPRTASTLGEAPPEHLVPDVAVEVGRRSYGEGVGDQPVLDLVRGWWGVVRVRVRVRVGVRVRVSVCVAR